MEKNQIACVCCPRGCTVTVDSAGRVSGNGCRNGAAYALERIQGTQRRITGRIRIRCAAVDHCMVKTDRPVPAQYLEEIESLLGSMEAEAPVYVSQVLIRDLCGTGANLVSCSSISRTTDS